MGYIKPEELQGKSPGEVITLYLNRANSTAFEPSQLDLVDSKPGIDEDGQYIEITVMPKQVTGWVNGPIVVKVPVFDVTEYYQDKAFELPYQGISGIGPLGTWLRDHGAPPAKPTSITGGLLEKQTPTGLVTITYHAVYTNVFFTGELPIRVTGVPESLPAIKIVNDILLNPLNLN